MGYFDRADRLLNKRCDFLEDQLQWPSNVPAQPPAGKKYLHFIGQGLTCYRTRDYSDNSNYYYRHYQNPAKIGSHQRGLYGLAHEDEYTFNVSWADFDTHGVNPFDHYAHTGFGSYIRTKWMNKMYDALRHSSPGLARTHTDQVRQLYKGWELTPADPEVSWAFQKLNLLEQAKNNWPLKSLLGQKHVIASDNRAYAFSCRQAGFNANNFKGHRDGYGYMPYDMHRVGRTSSRTQWTYNQILHHSPTIMLMTVEVPDDFDAWRADGANNGNSTSIKVYQRWVSVPHWIGYGVAYDYVYHAPDSNNYLGNTGYTSQYAGVVTSVSLYDHYNSNGNEHGDTYLFTPADAANEYLLPPLI